MYVFVVIEHARRHLVHFNVTDHSTARWTAQQLVEALSFDTAPRFLLRDEDAIYGELVRRHISTLGIQEVATAPASPWQNSYVERVMGSICRECLNYTVILTRKHLRRVLDEYVRYYNELRTHLAFCKDPPAHRPTEPAHGGNVVALPILGGLHYRYRCLVA